MAEARHKDIVECNTPEGRVLARVEIFAPAYGESLSVEMSPLVLLPFEEARQNGEERLQLRERQKYFYHLHPAPGAPDDLALMAQRGVNPLPFKPNVGEQGTIEPQDYCGLFPLTVVRRGDATCKPLARSAVEVRSLKLGSREHYRGMLAYIADRCAGLLLDCRSPTRLRLDALWRQNSRILEQQLEFLRHTLGSLAFRTAVNEVLRNPHRRLKDELEERHITRPFKHGRDVARQIASATRRVVVPEGHPLHPHVKTLPACVRTRSRTDYLDTAENRFVKMVLVEFREFLANISSHLIQKATEDNKPETRRLLAETGRLRGMLETELSRGFFPDVSLPSVLPLGSPVLQRKAGYRELFRFWLKFHAGAQLAWEGGSEIYEAGARNVATLYEYWLFFQLEALFRKRFSCTKPLDAIVVNRKKVPPQLELKRGVELTTPIAGVSARSAGRRLNAEFHFNRKFQPRTGRDRPGSWTRGVQPDYTISIWPSEYTKQEAEANELMIHVHFDAKYRVEHAKELLGDAEDDRTFAADSVQARPASAAKYADLLKMHAYRDAVRRTAGAYVLYPGNPGDGQTYWGFHEVLPGLGAFAIRPDKEGKAEGISSLAEFLDKVIEHLANRTSARERVTYHVGESYSTDEAEVPYSTLNLQESDNFGQGRRALPPAEHYILVAWYRDESQLEWTKRERIAILRLGIRPGAWHVQPEFAEARHLLLHSRGGRSSPGLWKIRTPGYSVYTAEELRSRNYPGLARGEIYAVFEVEPDPSWASVRWHRRQLIRSIRDFESRISDKLVSNIGRQSAFPRIVPLRDLLKAVAVEL